MKTNEPMNTKETMNTKAIKKPSTKWYDHSWNPLAGCLECSEGCENCWARKSALRGRPASKRHSPAYEGLVTEDGSRWSGKVNDINLHLPDRMSGPKGYRIAVCTMGDLFYEAVEEDSIREVFRVMNQHRRHTFMVLTKRPDRMAQMAPTLRWPNIWAGVTVESAQHIGRIDLLRPINARKFVVLQPLLGPMPALNLQGIDWVVVGGESGAGGRPMDPTWVAAVRDQCVAAAVPFWFEQIRGADERMQKLPLLDGRTWHEVPSWTKKGGDM